MRLKRRRVPWGRAQGLSVLGRASNLLEGFVWFGGVATKSGGFVGAAGPIEQTDRKVSAGRKESRRLAGAYPTSIFPKGHIPNPMQAVFDAPVVSGQGEQVFCVGLLSAEAGDAVDLLDTDFALHRPPAMKHENLSDSRPVEIVIEFGSTAQTAVLDSSVPLVCALSGLPVGLRQATLTRRKRIIMLEHIGNGLLQ